MPGQDVDAVDVTTASSPPTAVAQPVGVAPAFYEWQEIYPELQILLDHFDEIVAEAKTVPKVHCEHMIVVVRFLSTLHFHLFSSLTHVVDSVARRSLQWLLCH